MTHGTQDTSTPDPVLPGKWAMHPAIARNLWRLTDAQAARYAEAHGEAGAAHAEWIESRRREEGEAWRARLADLREAYLPDLKEPPTTEDVRALALAALGDDPGPRPWPETVNKCGKYLAGFRGDAARYAKYLKYRAKRHRYGEAEPFHFADEDPVVAHVWDRLAAVPGLAKAVKDAGGLVNLVHRETGEVRMGLSPSWHPHGPAVPAPMAKPVAPLAVSEGGGVVSAGLALVGATVTDPALLAAGLVEWARGSASLAAGGKRQGTIEGAPSGWNAWVLPEGEGAHPVDVLVATPAGVAYFEQHGGIVAWVKARKEASRLPQEAPLKPVGASADERAADRAKTRAVHAEIRALAGKGRRARAGGPSDEPVAAPLQQRTVAARARGLSEDAPPVRAMRGDGTRDRGHGGGPHRAPPGRPGLVLGRGQPAAYVQALPRRAQATAGGARVRA